MSACPACGKPAGTGTLLDFRPHPVEPYHQVPEMVAYWREFAVKYRCPACAEHLKDEARRERERST